VANLTVGSSSAEERGAEEDAVAKKKAEKHEEQECTYRKDVDFECRICTCDFEDGAERVLLDGDAICKDCCLEDMHSKFLAAANDIEKYPVFWGKSELPPLALPAYPGLTMRFAQNGVEG
jgi:hypothetical protein